MKLYERRINRLPDYRLFKLSAMSLSINIFMFCIITLVYIRFKALRIDERIGSKAGNFQNYVYLDF